MTKIRSKRADSAAAKIEAKRAAARPVQLPAHMKLDTIGQAHFDGIVKEFAAVELTDHKLQLCAMLAKAMAEHNRAEERLDQEGSVVTRPNGSPMLNPLVTYSESRFKSIMNLRRSLGLHAAARGDQRAVQRRREINKENEGGPRGSLIKRPPSSIQ